MLNPRLLSGITVTLYERTDTGERDAFGRAILEETPVEVENVLIQPLQRTTDAPAEDIELTGHKGSCVLGIPKGDAHKWEDSTVEFFGHRWRTESLAWQGIDALIPGDWNKKIVARRYDTNGL